MNYADKIEVLFDIDTQNNATMSVVGVNPQSYVEGSMRYN